MNFSYSESDEKFREEVREFVQNNVPERVRHLRHYRPGKEASLIWHRVLAKKGWAAWHWPVEYGGTGWTPMQRHIFETEMYAAGAPELIFQSFVLVGPLVYTFGTQQQKDRYLPKILSGDEIWCQGFSEPSAGSDLTHLRTRAKLDGDHYVINGSKLWTSGAQYAEMGVFLVRTDPEQPGSRGLSILIVDMKTPGITVRPVTSIDGVRNLNEVFLTDVRVPKENLIGEENKGWNYARWLLTNERAGSAFIHWSRERLQRARQLASTEMLGGKPLSEDTEFQRRLARAEAMLIAHEWSVLRLLSSEKSDYDDIAVAAVLKIRGAELQQLVTEITIDVLGPHALRTFDRESDWAGAYEETPEWPEYTRGPTGAYLMARAASIYGGAAQIQRSIIAHTAFGL